MNKIEQLENALSQKVSALDYKDIFNIMRSIETILHFVDNDTEQADALENWNYTLLNIINQQFTDDQINDIEENELLE